MGKMARKWLSRMWDTFDSRKHVTRHCPEIIVLREDDSKLSDTFDMQPTRDNLEEYVLSRTHSKVIAGECRMHFISGSFFQLFPSCPSTWGMLDELPAAESDRMKRQVQNCFTHGLSCNVEWTALTCTDQKLYRVYIMLLGCNLAEKSTLTTMDFDNLDVARHIYGLFRPL
jgi:hypothetical protein